MFRRAVAIAILLLAIGRAGAQPVVVADLGLLTPPVTVTRVVTIEPAQVAWVRFQVPAITNPDTWLDIQTRVPPSPFSPLSNNDPMLGVYGPSGLRVATDDDDGTLRQAALSFGRGFPTRPAPSGAREFNGRDGSLAPGVHYLSISSPQTAFGTSNWAVTSLSSASGSVEVMLDLGCEVCPAPPTATANCVPARAFALQELLVRVFTAPGANPAIPVTSVSLDLSAWGGPPDFALGDDGSEGDFATGDGIFTRIIPLPIEAPSGETSITFVATDELGRSASGTVNLDVAPLGEWNEHVHGLADAGPLIATAQRPGELPPVPQPNLPLSALSGMLPAGDADVFLIHIDDPAAFAASTAGTPADMQLFLFEVCGLPGRGLTFNDNAPGVPGTTHSRVTGLHLSGPGLYALAVTASDRDPIGQTLGPLWLDAPLNIERPPDGLGATEPLAGWMGLSPTVSFYVIHLAGCSRPVPPGADCPGTCRADIDGSGTLDPDDLSTYIACYFEGGGSGCPVADFDGNGHTDPDDLSDYIAAYFDLASPCAR